MTTFQEILDAAQTLPSAQRAQLIHALWETVSHDDWTPPSDEWITEAQRRSAAYDSGQMEASPWSAVRDRARRKAGPMNDLVVCSAAESEYADALLRYVENSVQTAERFDAEFDQALETIASDPQRFPRCDERHHYYLIRDFPYQIIYRSHKDHWVVIAVAHTALKRGYWSDR